MAEVKSKYVRSSPCRLRRVTIATEDDEAPYPAAPILRAAIDLQEELKRTGITLKQLYIIRQQREVFTQVFALLRELANLINNDHSAAPHLREQITAPPRPTNICELLRR